ncbi:MAG: hypothetical protein LBR60_02775 [Fibrobacter sp.]|jgi:glutamyl-tRNA synthetase/glutamyl-Q tRNA(Asp) synthetase|nr:hypothetical protein [Fibrobacter sp.]
MPSFTRFAPSPTGFLHRGHLLSALWVWGMAERFGLPVLLRIEDHDQSRARPEFVAAIREDLIRFGFRWERASIQSERDALYRRYFEFLQDEGLVYPCSCSRKSLSGERYPGFCRDREVPDPGTDGLTFRFRIPEGIRIVWDDLRLGSFEENPSEPCGDFALRDRLNQWTYQFAVCVDDIDEKVDLVVRGEDLRDSTARQILLMRFLGRETPPRYLHHPLLFSASGEKLSKRFHAVSLRGELESGISPEEILGSVCFEAGLLDKKAVISLREAISLILQCSKSFF